MMGECGSCTYFGAIDSQEWWKGPSVALSLQGPGRGEVREGAGADRAQGRRPDRDQVRVLVAPTAPLRNLLDFTQGLDLSDVGQTGQELDSGTRTLCGACHQAF